MDSDNELTVKDMAGFLLGIAVGFFLGILFFG